MPDQHIGNSNQILTISGVVSAPAYSWASDNNTGLYRIGADNIGVAANGAKVLDIATTGLTVTGAFASSNGISSTLTTDASSSTTGSIITAGGISTQKALWVGTTSRLVGNVQADGLLGIGKTPTQVLDVSAAKTIAQFSSSTGTNACYAVFNNTGGNNYVGTDNSTGGDFFGVAYSFNILTGGAYPIIFGTGNTERARINSSGFIVGTGTAVATLTLNGQSGTGASKGWAILPQVAGVAAGIIGSENYVFGSSDTNLVIQAATSKSVKIFGGAGGGGLTISSAGVGTFSSTISCSGISATNGAFTNTNPGAAVDCAINSSGATTQISLFSGGSVGALAFNGAAFVVTTTSDERLKNWSGIEQTNYRAGIEKLWIGSFDIYKNKEKTGDFARGFGVLAQQAYDALGGLGITKPTNEDDIWQASSEPFAFLALWGVKDLYAENEALKARLTALENK